MTARIIDYKPGHTDLLTGIYTGDAGAVGMMETLVGDNNFIGKTLIVDDCVYACIACLLLWSGVGEVCTFPSSKCIKKPKIYYKAIKDVLSEYQKKLNLWRVQTPIRVNYDINIRWIEKLGFKREGLMKSFGANKEDYYLYAKVY